MSSTSSGAADRPISSVVLPKDLPSLTSFRAFAALYVLIFHLGLLGVVSIPGWHMGYTGVGFFFVLSGFVLTWSSGSTNRARSFYWRRFARIYPTYFVVLILAILTKVYVGTMPTSTVIAANLFLIQAWSPNEAVVYGINGVAWSLSCEAAFYAAFPMIIFLFRRASPSVCFIASAAPLLVVLLFAIFAPESGSYLYHFPLSRMAEFVIGISVALAMQRGWRPRWPLWTALASVVAALTVLSVTGAESGIADPIMAVLFAMVIAASAKADVASNSQLLRRRGLVYLGQVSYAFYLVHQMVIVAFSKFGFTGIWAGAADLSIALTIAIALHHGIERPMQRVLVRRRPAQVTYSEEASNDRSRDCSTTDPVGPRSYDLEGIKNAPKR